MDILIGLIAIILAITGIVWYRKSVWQVVAVASSPYTDEIKEKYSLLQNKGIRCKLESLTQEHPRPIANHAAGHFADFQPPETSLQLLVHKKDVDKAKRTIDIEPTA